MIEFKCPQCSQLIQAKPASAGKISKCPQCQSSIQIPLPRKNSPEPPPLNVNRDVNQGSQQAGNKPASRSDEFNFMDEGSLKKTSRTDENRYPALKLLSKCFSGYAILTIIGTVFWIIAIIVNEVVLKQELNQSVNEGRLMVSVLMVLLSGLFSVLVLYSISEIIKLFIDIEKNTRRS